MSANEPNHLFFTSKDDPREDCIIIGFTYGTFTADGTDKPIFYRFTTEQTPSGETRTRIARGNGEFVASLDWSMHDQLGMVSIGEMRRPMSYWYIRNPTNNNIRRFRSVLGHTYEWRKSVDAVDFYDLCHGDSVIATFRREARSTPVGPAHAVMQYTFDNDDILLDSLIALCLFRWFELRGHQ